MEDTAPPDVDVVSRKGLGEAKAYKVLKKFLKKDSEKPVNDQLPGEVAHQLQCVRDSLQALRDGGSTKAAGQAMEEEVEEPPVAAEVDGSAQKPKKKRHKKN